MSSSWRLFIHVEKIVPFDFRAHMPGPAHKTSIALLICWSHSCVMWESNPEREVLKVSSHWALTSSIHSLRAPAKDAAQPGGALGCYGNRWPQAGPDTGNTCHVKCWSRWLADSGSGSLEENVPGITRCDLYNMVQNQTQSWLISRSALILSQSGASSVVSTHGRWAIRLYLPLQQCWRATNPWRQLISSATDGRLACCRGRWSQAATLQHLCQFSPLQWAPHRSMFNTMKWAWGVFIKSPVHISTIVLWKGVYLTHCRNNCKSYINSIINTRNHFSRTPK